MKKEKFSFAFKMLSNGNFKGEATKAASKNIEPGDIDKFCDEVIEIVEKTRRSWKEFEKE